MRIKIDRLNELAPYNVTKEELIELILVYRLLTEQDGSSRTLLQDINEVCKKHGA